ncbi:MAG TPA: amidohydrolase family protein [Gemmatimonadaceae bacterium]|nr:amidohydrolase family protein [Gemmatimonadaceae bacterium]
MRSFFAAVLLSTIAAAPLAAQRPTLSAATRQFVAVDTSVVALTNARVIDGSGAPSRPEQTIIIRDGRIAAIGNSATLQAPAGALVMDLTGKSVIPGLVMVHEHLTYPTAPGVSGNLIESFSRLYLAGGVTSMRTAGNVSGLREIQHKKAIDAGASVGPWMDATAPFVEGAPGMGLDQFYVLKDAAEARSHVAYWTGIGATSLKAYMHLTRDELRATLEEGHKRGLKVTGHLCSITYREAADLGIDNLEHGFFAATDFVSAKQPDVCPDQNAALQSLVTIDPSGEPMRSLMRHLIEKHVALTSTLTVFESFTPGRPVPPGLDVLVPSLRDQFLQTKAQIDRGTTSVFVQLFPKLAKWDVDFFRAGGTLLVGTDPTGIGGVVAGYSNQRALELLVEAGLTPLEAIQVGTLNGATFLGRAALTGSLVAGKQADLVVIDGDPSAHIEDIRKVTLVFKQGVAYDPAKLIASVKGRAGLF